MSRFIYVFMSTQTSIHWRTIVIIKDVLTDCPALSMALENIKGFLHTQILQEHIFKIPFCFSQWVSIPIHQALSPGLMAFLHLLSFLPSGGSVLCSSDYWLSSPKLLLLCDPVLQKKKRGEIGVTGILSADGDVVRGGGQRRPMWQVLAHLCLGQEVSRILWVHKEVFPSLSIPSCSVTMLQLQKEFCSDLKVWKIQAHSQVLIFTQCRRKPSGGPSVVLTHFH